MSRFPRFHEKHGPAFECDPVPQERFELYAGKVPDELLDEWRESGFCGYSEGFLWTVDPVLYTDILSEWFDQPSEEYALLRTAFGGILYWDGKDNHYLDVLEMDTSPVFRRMDMLFDGMLCDDTYLKDVMRYDLFCEALPRLGRLHKDECYGYLPPLAMGGPGTIETLKRVKLREHLAILAQLKSE